MSGKKRPMADMAPVGMRRGRLKVVGHVEPCQGVRLVEVECLDCHEVKLVSLYPFRREKSGCQYCRPILKKHGKSGTRIYGVWCSMLSRCRNQNNVGWKNYGGRGIKVCKRWEQFENFYEDMGDQPEGMTLERVDNDGDYRPGNCVWDTPKAQSNNSRNNVLVEYQGRMQTLAQWCDELELSRSAVRSRLAMGQSATEAFETPVAEKTGERHHKAKLTRYDVRQIRLMYATGWGGFKAIAAEFGVDWSTIREIVERKIWKHVYTARLRQPV